MKSDLKILHLEDLDADAELVARELRKGGIKGPISRATNRDEFVKALIEFEPDIILSDHSLPSFDSEEALTIVNQSNLHVPFILITSTVSEEYAVNVMKKGASDYILKDRMQRLPNAVRTAMEKYETEAELARQLLLQQKLVAETNIRAQEKVRNEIGRELHDNINQILAAAKLYIDGALKFESHPADMLLKGQTNIAMAIDEIRRLSHVLVAPVLSDIQLVQLINDLIEDVHNTTNLKIKLSVKDYKEEVLEKDIKITIYRIIQEQLSNILKHSGAENTVIRLEIFPGALLLQISDDGKGVDTSKKTDGIGLQNIKNRVEYYDGSITLQSSAGSGCKLDVSIPIKKSLELQGLEN
ncbi:MAG TPA: response regulator [Chitinophagaceae bacterium]